MATNISFTLVRLVSPLLLLGSLLPYFPLPTPPVLAQTADTAEADRLIQQALNLYRQGHYAEAIPLAEQALVLREKALGADHLDVANSLNTLADLYRVSGQVVKAESLYQRSLAIREKQLGPNDTAVAVSLNNLALAYYEEGQYAKAEPLYQRSLAIFEKVLGPNHSEVGTSLNNLALLYQYQGQYAKAEPFYQRSLAIREKALGPEHPNVAQSLTNLAELYRLQGQYAKAEPLYQRGLSIREKQLGPNHPDVAVSLNNLALMYFSQGLYAKAEPIYQRSLGIYEKALGPEHPEVATSLNNLALLYQYQGQYAKAEPFYQRSLAIRKKALGPAHPEVATSLNNLALLYQYQGQYAKAEPFYQRSLAIREKALGLNHPNVANSLSNLAELYRLEGQYAKAEPLYQRSLAIREKVLGSTHPDIAVSLNNLALLYYTQGLYTKAEPLYQRSLGIYEKALGPEHPEVATSLNNLAELYRTQGLYAKAEPFYQRSLAIREKALGSEHPNVAQSLTNLAELYRTQGQYAKAEPLYRRGLAIREKVLGTNHPDIAVSLNNLALMYSSQGFYAKAEPLYQRSLNAYEKALGPEHPEVATSLNNLALLYQYEEQFAKAEPLYQRSLAIREKVLGLNHANVAQSLNNLALLYEAQEQYAKAEPILQRSFAIWEKALGSAHPDIALSLNNLAVLYQAENDLKRAVQYRVRALDIEETNLSQNLILGTEQDKRDYLSTFLGSTYGVISLHLQAAPNNLDAAKLAFTTILRRKGRILDVLGQNLQQLRQRLDPTTQKDFDQLIALRSQLAQLVSQANLSNSERQTQYQALTLQTQALETNLSRKSVAFQQATQSVTLAAVQAAIPQDAALVEFIQYQPFNPKAKLNQRFGSPRYAVYLLRSDGQPQWADLGTVTELDRLISTFRQTIQDRRIAPDQVKATARQLDAKLMQPVRALLKQQPQHLLIAPDGQLNLIPFSALVDEKNQYLLETYQITYLTSGRDLLRHTDPSAKVQAALVIANPNFSLSVTPKMKTLVALNRGSSERAGDLATLSFNQLQGTALEAQSILSLIPQARLFTGNEATKTIVQQSANPEILHLATHGFFLKNKPSEPKAELGQPRPFIAENPLLRSGLAMAGINNREGSPDNGVLTALEVAGLDLRATELVVLSACDTGLGEVANGEGVYGLRRAFTLAGAHSQLMSLWKVNDLGAKDLMIRYYQALQQGQGRGEALRQVQLDMLNQKLKGQDDTSYQHPYYWSAFIPLGDWLPLPKK